MKRIRSYAFRLLILMASVFLTPFMQTAEATERTEAGISVSALIPAVIVLHYFLPVSTETGSYMKERAEPDSLSAVKPIIRKTTNALTKEPEMTSKSGRWLVKGFSAGTQTTIQVTTGYPVTRMYGKSTHSISAPLNGVKKTSVITGTVDIPSVLKASGNNGNRRLITASAI